MKLYIVTHADRYGATSYFVSSESFPTIKQVVRGLDLHFEPRKAESIQITNFFEERFRNPKRLNRISRDDGQFEEYYLEKSGDREENTTSKVEHR